MERTQKITHELRTIKEASCAWLGMVAELQVRQVKIGCNSCFAVNMRAQIILPGLELHHLAFPDASQDDFADLEYSLDPF